MSIVRLWPLPLLAVLSLVGGAGAAAGPARPKQPAGAAQPRVPAAGEMVGAILSGSGAGRGKGWFRRSQGRYDWKWLAGRMGADRDGVIPRKEFKGAAGVFDRIDRDGDGKLTPADFDWSP